MRRPRSITVWTRMVKLALVVGLLALAMGLEPARASDVKPVAAGFIRAPHLRETVSILDIPAEDDGVAGARLAVEDNNTTGRFLGQSFSIEDIRLKPGDDPLAALNALAGRGVSLILLDLPAAEILALADAAKDRNILLFNTSAPEDALREENCRANVIHVAPTHSMLADGLAQYLVWKQWKRWFLIKGSHPEDELFADALRRSAKKFGAKIVEERLYEDTGGGRRSDWGACKRKGSCRPRRRTRRPMTFSSPPTKATSSPIICLIAPMTRARSRARPD